jgi:hypothetical protein
MVRCLLRLVLRRLAWVTAAGECTVPDHHRCVDGEAELRSHEFLDSLVGVEGAGAVKKFPAPRSARAAIRAPQWSGTRFLLLGHAVAAVLAPLPAIAAQRAEAAAVTRMYQRGRPAPLPGIRVNGGVVEAAPVSEPVTSGQ